MSGHGGITNGRQRGSVLILVLVLAAVMFIAIGAAFQTTTAQMRISNRSYAYKQAFAVADGGAQRAQAEITRKAKSSDFTLSGKIDNEGEFEVTAVGVADGKPVIRSTGYVPAKANYVAKRQVELKVDLTDSPSWFNYGIFGYDDVTCSNAFQISSLNSKTGKAHAYGDIGCLANVTIANGSKINGSIDAFGSVFGNKKGCQGTDKDGKPNKAYEGVKPVVPGDFPEAKLQAAKTSNNNLTGISCSDKTYNPYNAATQVLTVTKGNVTLAPGTYYFKGFSIVSNNGSLNISPEGSVNIYLEGDMSFNNHAQVNASGLPANLKIFMKSGSVSLDNACNVHAALLAPNSDIQFDNTSDFFGSMIGKKIDIGNAKGFVYDEALGDETGPPEDWNIVSWAEVVPEEEDE